MRRGDAGCIEAADAAKGIGNVGAVDTVDDARAIEGGAGVDQVVDVVLADELCGRCRRRSRDRCSWVKRQRQCAHDEERDEREKRCHACWTSKGMNEKLGVEVKECGL